MELLRLGAKIQNVLSLMCACSSTAAVAAAATAAIEAAGAGQQPKHQQ
jgi:hypothetical protein